MSTFEVSEPIQNSPFEKPARYWYIQEGFIHTVNCAWELFGLIHDFIKFVNEAFKVDFAAKFC